MQLPSDGGYGSCDPDGFTRTSRALEGTAGGGTSLPPHGTFSSEVEFFTWSLDPRDTNVGDASSSERLGPEQSFRHFCHISLGSDESQV